MRATLRSNSEVKDGLTDKDFLRPHEPFLCLYFSNVANTLSKNNANCVRKIVSEIHRVDRSPVEIWQDDAYFVYTYPKFGCIIFPRNFSNKVH